MDFKWLEGLTVDSVVAFNASAICSIAAPQADPRPPSIDGRPCLVLQHWLYDEARADVSLSVRKRMPSTSAHKGARM